MKWQREYTGWTLGLASMVPMFLVWMLDRTSCNDGVPFGWTTWAAMLAATYGGALALNENSGTPRAWAWLFGTLLVVPLLLAPFNPQIHFGIVYPLGLIAMPNVLAFIGAGMVSSTALREGRIKYLAPLGILVAALGWVGNLVMQIFSDACFT